MTPKSAIAKGKRRTLKQLKKDAWKVFSIWVRKSNSDWRGYTTCITCNKQYLWNSGEIHAGHWIHDKLDYDPRNVHPQCRNCNYKYNKNVNTAYAVWMARKYGPDEMEKLRKEAFDKGNNYTREELEGIINKYKELIKN